MSKILFISLIKNIFLFSVILIIALFGFQSQVNIHMIEDGMRGVFDHWIFIGALVPFLALWVMLFILELFDF